MDKIRLVYILSEVGKALAFEWIAEELDTQKFDLSFILVNPVNDTLSTFLKSKGIPVTIVTGGGKKDWPGMIWHIYKQLKLVKADVVHCHLKQATLFGLLAAKMAGVKSRIHTRHHSSFHHIYFPKGVWWDKLNNKLSTKIVAISGLVKKILIEWEGVPEEKVVLIPHGFRLEQFERPDVTKVAALKQKYNSTNKQPVIGVISRFIELKGAQYIIPAFKRLLQQYPDALILFFNAHGDYEAKINKLLSELPANSYKVVTFEHDIASLYGIFDMFIHVPIGDHYEAFGQIYVEALAAGVPSIFTLSGIAPDFIKHKENAWVVPYKDTDAIYEGMIALLTDQQLVDSIKTNGRLSVKKTFDLQVMIKKLEELYEQPVH